MLNNKIDQAWIERIIRSLENLEYGSVQIIVHDSQITQIERLEKFRYPLDKKTSTPQTGKSTEYKKVSNERKVITDRSTEGSSHLA
jgi:hypothetical protein